MRMRTKIIGDVGSNFVDIADLYQSIIQAKKAGLIGIKIQHFSQFDLENMGSEENHKNSTPLEWLPKLHEYAYAFRLNFSCTFFNMEKFKEHNQHCDFYKIASRNFFDYDYVRCAMRTAVDQDKRLYISNRNSFDLSEHIKIATEENALHNCVFLHCVPKYPAKYHDYCDFKKKFADVYPNLKLGISDHTKDCELIKTYPKYIFEKHIKIKDFKSPDNDTAIRIKKLGELIEWERERSKNILNPTAPNKTP